MVIRVRAARCRSVGQNTGRIALAEVDPGALPLAGAAALRFADLGWQGRPPPAAPDKRAPPGRSPCLGALRYEAWGGAFPRVT
jgi:hypothetical protein